MIVPLQQCPVVCITSSVRKVFKVLILHLLQFGIGRWLKLLQNWIQLLTEVPVLLGSKLNTQKMIKLLIKPEIWELIFRKPHAPECSLW